MEGLQKMVRWFLDANDSPNSHQNIIITFWPIYNVLWNLHANLFHGICMKSTKQQAKSMWKQLISFAQVIKFCKISSSRVGGNQGCRVGSPVIRLPLLEISIIRLQLRLRPDSDSKPTPTFSCISYLLKVIILFRWIHKPYLHFPGIRKLILKCKCTFISHFCKIRSSRS